MILEKFFLRMTKHLLVTGSGQELDDHWPWGCCDLYFFEKAILRLILK